MNEPTQEHRRRIYEQLASEQCRAYVAVRFLPEVISVDGTPCYGCAQWSGYGHHEILLENNMPLAREAEVAAHEVAHVWAGHVPLIAPSYARRLHAILREQANNKSSGATSHKEWAAEIIGLYLLASWRASGRIEW